METTLTKYSKFTLLVLLSILVLFLMGHQAQATHLKGGVIYYEQDAQNYLHFKFTVVTYTVLGGFQDEEMMLHFGDCTSAKSIRAERFHLANDPSNTQINRHYFEHTFSGAGTFVVSYASQNRNLGIINLQNSVGTSFLIQTTVTVDPFLAANRSPVFTELPTFEASRNQTYYHSAAGFDADGDSLSFKVIPVKMQAGTTACGNIIAETAPGYLGLENFAGAPASNTTPFFKVDAQTGLVTWNSPSTLGTFTLAIEVEEWRDRRLIGKVMRDFEIQVRENPFTAQTLAGNDQTICPGTSVQLGQAPVPGYRYQWRPATGLSDPTIANPTLALTTPQKVTYVLEVNSSTANALPSSDAVEITVLPAPQPITISKISDNLLAASGTGLSYEWRKDGEILSGETAAQLSVPASGEYTVRGKLGTGCYSAWSAVAVVQTLTAIPNELQNAFRLYPNPVTSASFTVQVPASVRLLKGQVLDLHGKVARTLSLHLTSQGWDFNVQNQPAGLYLILLETDHGFWTKRVVVRQ